MIYFVRPKSGGRIKIGTTLQLSQRLRQLATEYGELEVMAVVEGGHDGERALHRRFAHLRVVNEWFEPGDDLIGFIVSDGKPWDGTNESGKIDVRLRMDGELHKRIQAAADEDDNSVAAFIRSAVVKELKRREKGGAE